MSKKNSFVLIDFFFYTSKKLLAAISLVSKMSLANNIALKFNVSQREVQTNRIFFFFFSIHRLAERTDLYRTHVPPHPPCFETLVIMHWFLFLKP